MPLAQRFSINTPVAVGPTAGANLSQKDIFPIQPVSKGTGVDDEKLTLQQIQAIPYGAASLSGTTYNVTFSNYPTDFNPVIGQTIIIKFNNAKAGTDALNLSINGQLIPMLMQGEAITEIAANQIIEFTMIGNIVNGSQTITHANASAGVTAAKVTNQINGALVDYNKQVILTSGYNDTIENIVSSLRQNGIIQVGQNTVKGGDTYANRIVITNCGGISNTDATLNTTLEINYTSANIYSVRILIGRSYGTTIKSGNIFYFYKESSTLTYWEKVVTENETPIIKGLYTDCNSCYEVPKTDGMKVSFYQAQANSPDNNYGWMLEVKVTKAGTTFFGSQIATRNGGVPLMYIRTLSFNSSGVATSFGKWRKITLDES